MTTTATTTTFVPAVERAACQILANDAGRITHPVLRAYVEAMLADPDFADSFDASAGSAWTPSAAVVAYAGGEGFRAPTDGTWGAQFASSWGPDYYGETHADQLNREIDLAIGQLAFAIHAYRGDGRPGGDQTRAIHGVGGPLAIETSSLAARLAEYHSAMVTCYRDEAALLRRGLRRLGYALDDDGQVAQLAPATED